MQEVVASTPAGVADSPAEGRHIRGRVSLLHVGTWLVPALVALVIGRWGLNRVGIDRDESATIDISSRSLRDIWRMTGNADAVHGLYYALMHFWTRVFGDSTAAIRTPSLIGAAIAAALVAVLGTRLASRTVGFIAGLLFATAPQISLYAHDGRSYGIDAVLVICLTLVLHAALRSPRRRIWIGYAALAVLMVVMHLFTLLALTAHAVTAAWYARHERRRAPLVRFLVAAVAAVIVVSPFLVRAIRQGGTASWISPVTWGSVSNFMTSVAGGWISLAIAGVLLVVAVVRRSPVVPYTLPLLAIPPALILVYSVHQPLYVFRYILYTVPALMLLVASGAVELAGLVRRSLARQGAGPRAVRLGPVVAAVLVAGLIAAAIPMQQAVRASDRGATDLRGQAAWLTKHKQPGDALVFLTPSQREYKASYPTAYRGLYDVGEGRTPAQAANFAGTEVSDDVLVARLRSVERAFTIEYWVPKANRPANRKLEAHRDALMVLAGLHWAGSAKFRGGYIQIYER